jgi:AP-1-like transcription factor
LEKASDKTSQENGVLRAQVDRLQVELREYRKRLSWLSTGNGFSTASAIQDMSSRNNSGIKKIGNNDFYFDFPKFGDLPSTHIFDNKAAVASPKNKSTNESSRQWVPNLPGVLGRPSGNSVAGSAGSVQNNRSATVNESTSSSRSTPNNRSSFGFNKYQGQTFGSSAGSATDSPSSSTDSQHGQPSSIGTTPEPSLNSPSVGKTAELSPGGDKIDGEVSFCAKLGKACGCVDDPVPAMLKEQQSNGFAQISGKFDSTVADNLLSFDWIAQQNGGSFDPVLFNDYREPQDAILSQDFGSFFNEAFPLPDLGSPLHNFNDATTSSATQFTTATAPAPKSNLVAKIDSQLNADDVVPGMDRSQMMDCAKIW